MRKYVYTSASYLATNMSKHTSRQSFMNVCKLDLERHELSMEKNTAYFLNLEKRRQPHNTLNKLKQTLEN